MRDAGKSRIKDEEGSQANNHATQHEFTFSTKSNLR